jgi:hypothetical protein
MIFCFFNGVFNRANVFNANVNTPIFSFYDPGFCTLPKNTIQIQGNKNFPKFFIVDILRFYFKAYDSFQNNICVI